jgi:hypothetical protein
VNNCIDIVNCGALGRGLVAARNIDAGEIILTFRGASSSLGDILALEHAEQGVSLQVGDGLYLVPQPPGALVNHGCSPSAGIQFDYDLVALRAIVAGEPVVMDYPACGVDGFVMRCQCGSSACRGWITDFRELSLLSRTPPRSDCGQAPKVPPPTASRRLR